MNYLNYNEIYVAYTSTEMYMHMKGNSPKVCTINESNAKSYDIMVKHGKASTKEEFEGTMPSTSMVDALYKVSYLSELDKKQVA